MAALADAVVPPLEGDAAADLIASLPVTASQTQKDLVAAFAKEGFSSHPELLDKWARQAAASLSPATRNDISLLLTSLGTRVGCLALTGHFGPFYDLPRSQREAALHSWSNSPITLLRKGAAGIKGLTLLVFYRANPTAWKAIGYADGANVDWQQAAEEVAGRRVSTGSTTGVTAGVTTGGRAAAERQRGSVCRDPRRRSAGQALRAFSMSPEIFSGLVVGP